jgi:hypothetical protein
MITVTRNVGRLTEIRVTAPVNVDDLSTLQRDVAGILGRAQGRVVICADLSGAGLFSDEQAERMAKFFRTANAKLERTAIVVCGAATLFLQVERLLREGDRPAAPPSPPSRGEAPSARETTTTSGQWSARDSARTTTRTSGELPTATKRVGSDPYMNKRLGTDPSLAKRASERKAFRATTDAMTWLDEVLTGEERARLRMFLDGPRAR